MWRRPRPWHQCQLARLNRQQALQLSPSSATMVRSEQFLHIQAHRIFCHCCVSGRFMPSSSITMRGCSVQAELIFLASLHYKPPSYLTWLLHGRASVTEVPES